MNIGNLSHYCKGLKEAIRAAELRENARVEALDHLDAVSDTISKSLNGSLFDRDVDPDTPLALFPDHDNPPCPMCGNAHPGAHCQRPAGEVSI